MRLLGNGIGRRGPNRVSNDVVIDRSAQKNALRKNTGDFGKGSNLDVRRHSASTGSQSL